MKLSQIANSTYWWRHRVATFGLWQPSVSDDKFWFECQLNPKLGRKFSHIYIPALPPQEVQERFTARSGRNNLLQAFEFYKYICANCKVDGEELPKILDFGGGWGRIARFFLRDTSPDRIWLADVLEDSHYWLKATQAKFNLVKNEPLPPIHCMASDFDLIYAFSVFSHLAESHFISWVTYLLELLRPGGHLVFTSRGTQFISRLAALKQSHLGKNRSRNLPEPVDIRQRFDQGQFQFYSTGGGGELTEDFYGEAFVPAQFVERHFGQYLVSASEEVPHVDQAVFILRK